jgi:hypothetical protein
MLPLSALLSYQLNVSCQENRPVSFVEIFVLAVALAVFAELVNWKLWALREQRRFDGLYLQLEQMNARADQAAAALEHAAEQGELAVAILREALK